MRNVKADSLASVFTDSTLSAFTQNAINKGVTDDSVIYITCNSTDVTTFGSQYTNGSNWIWAKGLIFGNGENNKVQLTPGSSNIFYPVLTTSSEISSGSTTSSALYLQALKINPSKISISEGNLTSALGSYSHSEGNSTTKASASSLYQNNNTILSNWTTNKFNLAKGSASHSEGEDTLALGERSHTEGRRTRAFGTNSHAEGLNSMAYGTASHAEGNTNLSGGFSSHSEGWCSFAEGDTSHAEGELTRANGLYSHSEGAGNLALGDCSHVECGILPELLFITGDEELDVTFTSSDDPISTATLSFNYSGQEITEVIGRVSIVYGEEIYNEDYYYLHSIDFSSGRCGLTINKQFYPMGFAHTTVLSIKLYKAVNTSRGTSSHAEGYYTKSTGARSHAEGHTTKALGINSHTEGWETVAGKSYRWKTTSIKAGNRYSDNDSFLVNSNPTGIISAGDILYINDTEYVVAGIGNIPPAIHLTTDISDADLTWAQSNFIEVKYYDDTFGDYSDGGFCSHAEGAGTIAEGNYQHVLGKYNVADSTSAFIIGNGSSSSLRSNAFKVDWFGNVNASGNITGVGVYQTSDARKKEIKSELDVNKCYEFIEKCSPVIFNWKNEDEDQIGMIAQEVQEFFPEIVNTDENGYLSLDYGKLSVICLRVLKDLIDKSKQK